MTKLTTQMKSNHQINNVFNLITDNRTAKLTLYGTIGDDLLDGIQAQETVKKIENLDVDTLEIHINTDGGGVNSAVAIANTIKRLKAKTIAYIDGIVASAGTIITSSCDIVKMPKNALFMIHNPMLAIYGTAEDLKKSADLLEKVKNNIIETYKEKTQLSDDVLAELMDKETWLNSDEALKYGFINEIIDNVDIKKEDNAIITNSYKFNLTNYKNFKTVNEYDKGVKSVGINEEITLEIIKNKYTDIYNAIFEQGFKDGQKNEEITVETIKNKYEEVYNSIFKLGVEEERNRIKELDELGIKNDLVNDAKYTTFKNVNEIALDILKGLNIENKGNEDYRTKQKPIKNPMKNIDNEEEIGKAIIGLIK